MGQSKPFRATALVVEDDPMQREMICLLLEESDYDVIQCESAEAAELVLERNGGSLRLMMTDVHLAGHMNGVELAHIAKRRVPDIDVIVTSGMPLRQPLPDGAQFWSKPWAPLDVIRAAERMSLAHRAANDNA
ncbi:response regulator [Bradyrhizobium canariense]|uniref:CheY chemotaxis protein or a CheY-like REC (Receiver) domain n=1 Tax=Bradyrhizobium canariense TaxID=255045 RepID=A0A1H2AGJ1_9BRAD|nr:response regulator [Bradyrhizobium canariense]SDT45060.1 CheY chemotaxis protein or a CheY-like REC (receiver) domain [Bradyrhizobium canariense]